MLGEIKDRIGTGHQYKIEWSSGPGGEQKEEHLFGAFTRRDKHFQDGYVLALDDNDKIYKPARTISISNDGKTLTVQFLNKNEENSSPRYLNLFIKKIEKKKTFIFDFLEQLKFEQVQHL
jgi:hypothetical protein